MTIQPSLYDYEYAPPQRPELKLYDHQEEFLDKCRKEFARGKRRVLATAPTGAGKSECAAMMQKLASESKGLPTLFVVHRRGLVQQYANRLDKYGIPHGIIMAGKEYDLRHKIQVASLDTLDSRYTGSDPTGRLDSLPRWGLIIPDEAHTRFRQFLRLFNAYPEARVLGFTATPVLPNGGGMGEGYDALVEMCSISWLVERGYLVPARYFAPREHDLSKVKITSAGEYDEDSMAEVADRPELVGDVVRDWRRLGEDRPTMVFATNVAHSIHLVEEFNRHGIPAFHIDANTKDDVRESAYAAVSNGGLKVISNYGIFDRGSDIPAVSCCILARGIRNIAAYKQIGGRVLRTHPESGKQDAIVIDHFGNLKRHGPLEWDIEWTLDPKVDVNERERQVREAGEEKLVTCRECFATFTPQRLCPECGAEAPRPRKKGASVESRDGELVEVDVRALEKERKDFYAQLLGYARQTIARSTGKPYSRQWVHREYFRRYGQWPPSKIANYTPPKKPSDTVIGFIKKEQQNKARRRSYARRESRGR